MKTQPIASLKEIGEDVLSNLPKKIEIEKVVDLLHKALGWVNIPEMMKEYIVFLPVENYTAILPDNVFRVKYVAKVPNDLKDEKLKECFKDITDTVTESSSEEKCEHIPCNEENIFINLELQNILIPINSGSFSDVFTKYHFEPMHYIKEPFSVSNRNYDTLTNKPENSYDVVNRNIIKTSFQKGTIAVAYDGYILDDKGDILLYVNTQMYDMFKNYILKNLAEEQAWKADPNFFKVANMYEQKWKESVSSYISSMRVMKNVWEFERWKKSFRSLIPLKKYYE